MVRVRGAGCEFWWDQPRTQVETVRSVRSSALRRARRQRNSSFTSMLHV